MDNQPQEKWYFKTSVLVVLFLGIGALMLPLVWFNPRFTIKLKLIITAIIVALSYLLGILCFNSLKSVNKYYQVLS